MQTEDILRKRTKRLVGPYLFALAEDLVVLVTAGASVLGARKEQRRDGCALWEFCLLVDKLHTQNI